MDDAVRRKIEQGNEWYLADQRHNQLGTPGSRWALEGRWRLFAKLINHWVSQRGPNQKQIRVLDAGCGDGINMSVLKDIFASKGIEADIVGSDYNGVRLERAAAHGSFPVVEADLLKTPFKNEEFDVILCSHVLEHIHEDVTALLELKRILAPSGLMIIAVPNEGCALGWLRNHVVQRSILRTTDHIHFYTLKTLLKKTALAKLDIFGPALTEGFFVPHLGIYSRLRETSAGRKVISILARLFSSQSTGLIVAFRKPSF
ncbi:MAG: class I SAM-dependent methyltransferase [Polaromonas sp.]